MKKLILLSILLFPSFLYGQKWILGYGSEINFSKAKFSGTVTNSYNGESHSYKLDVNEIVANLSWSSMKIGYLTSNNFYVGLHGNYISPLLEEGKVIKDDNYQSDK